VAEGVVDILCGIIIHKTGRYRELTWVGVVMMTLGMGLFIVFDVDTSVATLVGLQIIGGIGTALLFQTPTIAVQNSVTQANTASAIAALACTGNFGTAVSVVIGGAIFQNSITKCQSTFASLNDTVVAAFTPDRAAASVDLIAELPNARIVQDAFAWSIRNIFITYTVIAGLAVVASIGLKQQHMSSEHVETKTGIETLTRLVKADDSTSGEVLKV
jgi:MFS family permease